LDGEAQHGVRSGNRACPATGTSDGGAVPPRRSRQALRRTTGIVPKDQPPVADTATSQQGVTPRPRGVTFRVLLLALTLVPLNSLFVLFMSYERSIFDPTLVALFWNVLFVLVIVRLVNQALLRWRPQWALTPGEMLVLWVLLAVSTSGAGMDSMQCTFMTAHGAFRFATPENHWQDLFLDRIPRAMTVSDDAALARLWKGDSSILDPRNLKVWIGPAARWWLLMSVLWTAPIGLAQFLRRRWIQQEKMGFPIVQLPLEIVREHPKVFSQGTLWIAAAIPVVVNLLGGLHTYYPAIPSFPTAMWDDRLNIGKYLAGMGRPWDAASGMLYVCLYPFIIGLGLLLPGELCLSMWLFFLVWRGEMVTSSWLGFHQSWDLPYQVTTGGYLALVGFPLWAARKQLLELGKRALATGQRDPGEPISYRSAALIFLVGFAFVVAVGVANKLSFGQSFAFFFQYFLMVVVIGRIRAEMGLPTHELERMGPTVLPTTVLGPRVLGLQNMTSLHLFYGFTRGMRNIPFPHQFEGLYFSERLQLDGRRLILATSPFISLGLAWAWFWTLYLSYNRGLGTYRAGHHTWFAQDSWGQLAGLLNANAPVAWGRVVAGVIGFGVYWGLMSVRSIWTAWPLHPAGFALGSTWYMAHMWFPMFIAWVIKWSVARWGGIRAVRALPLVAYGLILGDVGTGALWILYAMVRHVPAYAFWQ